MAEIEGKLKLLQAVVVDQWKSGNSAELKLSCGSGHLRVSLSADFGPSMSSWKTASFGASSDTCGSGSPSRIRRRQRRAAERAAVNIADFKKTGPGKTAAEKAAVERTAVERTAVERTAAERSADERNVAEIAAVEKTAAEKLEAEKAVVEKEAAEKAADNDHVASTSCAVPLLFTPLKIKDQSRVLENAETAEVEEVNSNTALSCWNCEGTFTPGHQCGDSPVPPITSSKGAAIVIGKESPTPAPLPLCHYCCHKGSGLHQVHYYQQCLCSR